MINVLVQSRGVIVGIAKKITFDDMCNNPELDREVRLQAINHIEQIDSELLKRMFIHGLRDAQAYPSDFTEVV